MENNNCDIKVDTFKDTISVTDKSGSITNNEILPTNELMDDNAEKKVRKRRRQAEEQIESKRSAEEEYNRELLEQQYKRLMHLLNRSKFYASYIVEKINNNSKEDTHKKINKKSSKRMESTDENMSPQEKMLKKSHSHDIRNYISKDVQKKINLDKDKLNLNKENFEAEIENEVENVDNDALQISQYFNGELRDYQKKGFQWLKILYENGINGILADEMGLGKTVQIIALLCHLIEKQQAGPYLIVAPLSTIPNWKIEFEKFAPELPVVVYHGTRDERAIAARNIKQKHKVTESFKTQPIVLTSFEIPTYDKHFIQSQNWRYIIVDEGHRLKNYECLLIKILKRCRSMNRLLLTGTPLQNNLAELWSLLNFLLPEIFDDLAVFESWFDAKEFQGNEGTKKFLQLEREKHVLSSLREILQPFMLRREKADVCIDIPQKKEIIVYAPLTKLQHDLYKAVLTRDIYKLCKPDEPQIIYTEDGSRPKRRCALKTVNNMPTNLKKVESSLRGSNESVDSDNYKKVEPATAEKDLSMWKQFTDVTTHNQEFLLKLTYLNRLAMYKKIVNHPYLVYCPLNFNGTPKIDEDLIRSSGKLLILDKLFSKLKAQGHKVLLFSTMTTMLDVIEDYLYLRDYKFVRLDGSVNLEDRKENIQTFNSDPDIFVFLITTRAGGVGLNLVGADTVIIYDSDWNPQMDIQAMARCHRIGQTKPVVIYKLCTKGTIDEAIIHRAEAKRFLEKMVISKQLNTVNLGTKETLMELQRLLESKETQVVKSENEVFTEEELNKLLDRSELYRK
ncbi:lymphoid-specific helicase [Megachile rotundata]|uniref:lymphoid-specific helicase n=1 Tax=Megachile rotundata TaxID=143995 RepID=UPI000258D489|nr:PREDICTED: lymphoid-specific helicase-like isoform X2 [Megachile rotundata]XP_012153810.1 PREDICTED: lymphoid-specific helicase-like isoform X2 [Megachile rotundata]